MFALVAGILAVVAIGLATKDYMALNAQSSDLTSIGNYDIQVLRSSNLAKDAIANVADVKDLITFHQDAMTEKERSVNYFSDLQKPYKYFLQYILFPSMNIWKDRYGDKIDTTIIGQSYLQKNPYMDNNLIAHWTDFFRDIGKNTQYNEINDISIGTLSENINDSFTLPISLSFSSTNKRSFLMLVDKLSITSNRGNISLINEFLYNLWQEIDESKAAELSGANDVDRMIGR